MSSVETIQKATPINPPPEFFDENIEMEQQEGNERSLTAASLAQVLRNTAENSEWMAEGACYGSKRAASLLSDGSTQEYHQGIKEYCNSCPVKNECLMHAIEHDEQRGVWGGMTPTQRRLFVRSTSSR